VPAEDATRAASANLLHERTALSLLGHYGESELPEDDEGPLREYMERTVWGIPYWAVGAGIAAYFYWLRR
jgi:hypothetical protein